MENWTREEWREAATNGQVSMQATRKRWGITEDEDVWEWFERQELLESGRASGLPDGYVAVRKDDLFQVVNFYSHDWSDGVFDRLSEALGEYTPEKFR